MINLYNVCLVLFVLGIFPPNTTTDTPCDPSPYEIDVYNVTSSVKNRFACTRVYSEIINTGNVSREICFSLQIPSEAFVSGLCLEVGGKKYAGVVREKEEARQTHEENVDTGVTSGLIESRGMDQFHVCLSAGPNERALFSMEYQQLLIMRLGTIKYSVNIQPTQYANKIYGRIEVEDTAEVGSVEVTEGDLTMNSGLIISEFNSPPVIENPTGCEEGVSVDFGISYRPVPVSVGVGTGTSFGNYFIQFFSPIVDLECICQNFIFVIDKSGSMSGLKIQQAKEAAEFLLNSLNDIDFFNVIAFESTVIPFRTGLVSVGTYRQEGLDFIRSLQADGGTDINAGVITATNQLHGDSSGCVSQITLLSDGQANTGVTDSVQIADNIRTSFQGDSRSLNTLAFGIGADKELLKTLAYGNGGRYQVIYEGTDSKEQLVGFLETVLCPLLSEISFNFPDENVSNLSVTSFPTYYRGDEIIVSGEILSGETVSFEVTAIKSGGVDFQYQGQIGIILGELEEEELCLEAQLHAYQLIRQTLEQVSAAETIEEREVLKRQILEYALKFRFVTDLTSLIVSPLLSDGCECPSSCSCTPSSCMVTEINPVTYSNESDVVVLTGVRVNVNSNGGSLGSSVAEYSLLFLTIVLSILFSL